MEVQRQHNQENETHQAHITSYRDLIGIWIGLMVLTLMTVAVSVLGGRLATMAVTMAMFIATGKSFIVASRFMHVKYDKPVYKILGAIVMVLFVSLILFTILDYATR
jgi:cytochrome c oxidase subunit 4